MLQAKHSYATGQGKFGLSHRQKKAIHFIHDMFNIVLFKGFKRPINIIFLQACDFFRPKCVNPTRTDKSKPACITLNYSNYYKETIDTVQPNEFTIVYHFSVHWSHFNHTSVKQLGTLIHVYGIIITNLCKFDLRIPIFKTNQARYRILNI